MNEEQIQVNILSPDGVIFSRPARMLTADTPEGEIGILPKHISLVTPIDVGAVIVFEGNEDGSDAYVAVNGGILEVHDNVVNVVASYAIRARDIDEAEVLLRKQKAEAEMETARQKHDTVAYQRARIELKQAINQIKVRAAKLKKLK